MSLEVTLNIFSGRENPHWTLSDDQESDFMDQVASISTPTLSKTPGMASGLLGYRGFTVKRSQEAPRGEFKALIQDGIVDFGRTEESLISDDRALEQWLLQTAPGTLEDAVVSLLRDEALVSSSDTAELLRVKAYNRKLAAACPPCNAQDAPAYNPGIWNVPAVQPFNNCYNYANNQITNTFAQPGRAHGAMTGTMACPNVQTAAQADGLVQSPNFAGPLAAGQGWYVALVIWPGVDYHWYRQDINGCWSHKPGQTAARNTDNSGNPITDPQTCDRGPYTNFCNYMITKRGLVIN